MKVLAIAAALVLAATSAYAGGRDGYSQTRNTNINVNQSASASNSNASNKGVSQRTSFNDRLQPGSVGIGGGNCSDGFIVSFPGGGIGANTTSKVCRDGMDIATAKDLWGPATARNVACYLRPALRNLCKAR